MDPITLVVSALAVGASAALKDTAQQAVKDAYAAFRSLLLRKYRNADLPVQIVERDPASIEARAVVKKELTSAGGLADSELVAAAQRLVEAVQKHAPTQAAGVGINISEVVAGGSVILARLRTQSITAAHVTAERDFVISDVDTIDPKARSDRS